VSGDRAETLADRLAPVVGELEGIERNGGMDGLELRCGGKLFAVIGRDRIDVALDPAVAEAAQRTPDVIAAGRGAGWVSFRPKVLDGNAFDRAQAWLRSAHRGASADRR
jgi:hypothetical protein